MRAASVPRIARKKCSYQQLAPGFFTDNKKTYTYCKFRLNTSAILVKKFGQSKSTQYIYESIKKNINLIFKDHKEVFLIYVSFPRAGSRANTLELITKKDFI